MPAPAQTPVSRRFLPPSSAASARSQYPVSENRTLGYPRYAQGAKSPFPKTPFSSTQKQHHLDDIDTIVDNDGFESFESPLPPSIHRPVFDGDAIEDNSQDSTTPQDVIRLETNEVPRDERLMGYTPASTTKRRKTSHTEILSKHQDRQNWATTLDKGNSLDLDEKDHETSTPTIVVERERRSEDQLATPAQFEHAIATSNGLDSSSDIEMEVEIVSPVRTAGSRFRPAVPDIPTTVNVSSHLTSKPSFQTNPSRGPHPLPSLVLPDAFSPSRRKGALEYVPGGHAETVRRWILDLTAQESRGSLPGKNNAATGTANRMRVNRVIHDALGMRSGISSACFALVEDVDGTVWMLMSQGYGPHHDRSKEDASSASKTSSRLTSGCDVLLKGGEGTRWDLPMSVLPQDLFSRDATSLERNVPKSFRVATMWDIV